MSTALITRKLAPALAYVDDYVGVTQAVACRLREWSDAAERAYAPNTLRAWASDWQRFVAFCRARNELALPAPPATVCAYIEYCMQDSSAATIKRYLATLTRVHNAADCPNPCDNKFVRLARREMARKLPARQKQARGLVWSEIERFLTIEPEFLRDHRDRAMVMTAYDSMCRSQELVAVNVEDITFDARGHGVLLIARSKTDQEGEGAMVYLSQLTCRLIKSWMRKSKIEHGALFPAIVGKTTITKRLAPGAVATVYERVGLQLRLPRAEVARLSGHSVRVGATQDFLAANTQMPGIQQAGRWDTETMPARYGQHLLVERGAMARLAKIQGRDNQTEGGQGER